MGELPELLDPIVRRARQEQRLVVAAYRLDPRGDLPDDGDVLVELGLLPVALGILPLVNGDPDRDGEGDDRGGEDDDRGGEEAASDPFAPGAGDHPGLDVGLLQVAEVGVPQGLVEQGPAPEGVIAPAGFLPVPGRDGQAAAVLLLLPPLVEPGDQGRPALRQHHVGRSEGRPPSGSGQLANEPCVDELAGRVVGPVSGHAYPRQDVEEGVAGDRLEGRLAVRPGAEELHENLPGGALLVGGEALVEGVGGPLHREPPPADAAVGVPGDQVAPALAPELSQGELQQGQGERVAHQVVDQGIDHALLEPQADRGRRPGDRLAELAGVGRRDRHPGGLDQVAERPGLFELSGLGVVD